MKILTHKKFDKAFNKIPTRIQVKFYECIGIFLNDQSDKRLRNHALSGNFKDFRNSQSVVWLIMLGLI
jgi:mRNA-degrading endonuclease YafQ of YafQ-DinJ toxin-antitoxin module